MSDLTPGRQVTCTVKKMPRRLAMVKTVERLMRMQPHIQKGLRQVAKQRRQKDNHTYIRAGRPWVNRARVTKLQRCEVGETFTLFVTPQIIPELKSLEGYVDVN